MTQRTSHKWLIAASATLALLVTLFVVSTALAQGPEGGIDVETYVASLEANSPVPAPSAAAVLSTDSATSSALVEYQVHVNKKGPGTTADLEIVAFADATGIHLDELDGITTDTREGSFWADRLDQQIFCYAEPVTATLGADWTDITLEVYVDQRPYAVVTGQAPSLDTTLGELLAQPILTPVSYHVTGSSPVSYTHLTLPTN